MSRFQIAAMIVAKGIAIGPKVHYTYEDGAVSDIAQALYLYQHL